MRILFCWIVSGLGSGLFSFSWLFLCYFGLGFLLCLSDWAGLWICLLLFQTSENSIEQKRYHESRASSTRILSCTKNVRRHHLRTCTIDLKKRIAIPRHRRIKLHVARTISSKEKQKRLMHASNAQPTFFFSIPIPVNKIILHSRS